MYEIKKEVIFVKNSKKLKRVQKHQPNQKN